MLAWSQESFIHLMYKCTYMSLHWSSFTNCFLIVFLTFFKDLFSKSYQKPLNVKPTQHHLRIKSFFTCFCCNFLISQWASWISAKRLTLNKLNMYISFQAYPLIFQKCLPQCNLWPVQKFITIHLPKYIRISSTKDLWQLENFEAYIKQKNPPVFNMYCYMSLP